MTATFVCILLLRTPSCFSQQETQRNAVAAPPKSTGRLTSADGLAPLDQRPQPWRRRAEPILSARTTAQDWCRIVCYSPHVIHHDGRFRMWYLGTSEASRSNNIVMGYAESDDGFSWQAHPNNPILTSDDVPWGQIIQTPFVMFDPATQQFRMWFVSGAGVTKDESATGLCDQSGRNQVDRP